MANNPTTWGSYKQAYARWQSDTNHFAGVGYELVEKQCLTFVDLDKCINDLGQISAYALDIVQRLNSYTETSQSGKGLHIITQGNIPANIGADTYGEVRIEMYDHERYMIITGHHLQGTPDTIEDRQSELLLLHMQATKARKEAAEKAKAEKRQASKKKHEPIILAPSQQDSRYGMKALHVECERLSSAQEGGRWEHLRASGYRMGQLVGGGELTEKTTLDSLTSAALDCGLEQAEIDKTLESAVSAGIAEPRKATPVEHFTQENARNPGGDVDLCSFDHDDSGNGDAMFALYGNQFLWCGSRGWYGYTGTHWQLDAEGARVKQLAVETLRKRRHAAIDRDVEGIIKCCKADERRVNGCVSRFKTLVDISIDEFDKHPDLLNCLNGVVDLRTGTVKPHNYQQLFTYCVDVKYERAAVCPEWQEYLGGVVGGGQEVIDYLQLALGYSLTGHTNEECLFYLFGPPRAGKGTLSEIFMRLLPSPLSTGVDFNSFTAKRDTDVSNFDLAPLKPSRMVFASESNEYQMLNPAKIKQLTGGDRIRACYKHKDFFEYQPQFKVWMLSNQPVNGNPDDDALWTRVKVIEFPNSYVGKEDKSKKARLKSDQALQGILAWSICGAMKWYQLGSRGLVAPAQIVRATEQHRASLDYVQQWLDECCEHDEDAFTTNEQIMTSYSAWCELNGVTAKKSNGLTQSLNKKRYQAGIVGKATVKGKPNQSVRGVKGLKMKQVTDHSTLWSSDE